MNFRSRRMGPLGLACLLTLIGCGGDGADPDGGIDAGDAVSCAGSADGTACGTGLICVGEECVPSECGDGFVDEAGGEECDDGNEVAFDGCEPSTCTFTCSDAAECDDGFACTGAEACDSNQCVAGSPADDGTACSEGGVTDGVCRLGACVTAGCGNGAVEGDEDCDDGNDVDGDGCDNDCTFSCTDDVDCNDMNVCNGEETCDTTTNVCVPGTALTCTDTSACTMDTCDMEMGCVFPLIDADMDGFADMALGACGDDCDDTRDDVNPDEQEQCDAIDHDCDGSPIPPATPFWYRDCDGDGFASASAPSMQVCTEPPPQPCGGGWTLTAPLNDATTDCDDGDADAYPGQTMYYTSPTAGGGYDYDCDGMDDRRYTSVNGGSGGCTPVGSFCITLIPIGGGGGNGWTGSTAPSCGSSASYAQCTDTCLGPSVCCNFVTAMRTQECR